MIRKALSLAMLFMSVLCVSAQQPQLTPLPVNPKVKHGVLSNGLSYYIMHNEEPKQRANFYIAQKVGSSLETPDQLGLAHFLEHMAFNGTEHYPGKSMLNYLQSKGIRFGADINAYTGFDETVYNINNVNTADQALMDSVLLVLHDWSGSISLETAEINAERGVIQEEWRSRNDARTRMLMDVLPKIYEEYQYEQTPIGKMEVVMNFDPDVLRAYYKKWYRPDQQGIVIVGDFDVDAMEAKVKDLFSKIEMPKNAAKREYPHISDNKKPIYASFEDPEYPYMMTTISFKDDKVPSEIRNTEEIYVMYDVLVKQVLPKLINNRLTEYANNPDCKYAMAMVSFGDYWVSSTKAAFDVTVIGKDNMKAAVADAMAIVARACKTGFTDSELARVRDEIIANYDKLYNERDKTDSEGYGREIIRHFIDNEPAPGIEKEYELVKTNLGMIPVQAINQMAQGILTSENQVIVETCPTVNGQSQLTGEEVMVGVVNDAINAQYEAYVDEVITDPLISTLPAPGKVNSLKDTAFGTQEIILSNGVKVIVKTTDFAADEITMTAFRQGGKRSYEPSQAANVILMGDAFDCSRLGNFDVVTLKKYLAGKKVGLGYEVGSYLDVLNGSSTVKDLPTLMELLYAAFTSLSADESAYKAQMDQARSFLSTQSNNPEIIYQKELMKTRYNNNPMFQVPSVELIDAASYPQMLDMLKASMKNAAEYTFIFTGNVDVATLRPLLEQYVATLPVGMLRKVADKSSVAPALGDIDNTFKLEMQSPFVKVTDIMLQPGVAYNIENSVKVDLIGDILMDVYTNTLREEEGGTYSPGAYAYINPTQNQAEIIYMFMTNDEMRDKLMKRAHDEMMNLFKNGATEEQFNKAREAALKQYENNVRTNSYWENALTLWQRGWDTISGHEAAIKDLTLAQFNEFMKNLYDGKNRIQVVMDGVAKK